MLRKIIDFVIERPAVVVVLLVFAGQIIRGLLEARKARTAHEGRRDETTDDQRVREVQDQIRRQIAARRGAASTPAESPAEPPPIQPGPARPETTQLPELGGPLGRMLGELQRRAQPLPVPAAPAVVSEDRSRQELERQRQLAEQMRLLEEARSAARRRSEDQAAAQTAAASRASARGLVDGELGDPRALRRAFVLREILDAPVGLRRARS